MNFLFEILGWFVIEVSCGTTPAKKTFWKYALCVFAKIFLGLCILAAIMGLIGRIFSTS